MALRLVRPSGLTAALPARRVATRAAAVPRASAEANFAKAATAAAAAATLLSAGNALAAQSVVAEVAASAGDGRGAILASLALPALGWVAFNMAEPTKNQIDAMASKNGGGKVARALAAGLGLAAAMSVSSADAATSVGDIAASDNRLFIILGLFLPAIGWVLFNMAGPVLNQINSMADKNAGAPSKGKGGKRRSVAGAGLGLSAAALLAGANSADAATNLGEIAASDNRLFIILGLFLPAIGWVLFNMAGPVLNQISSMTEKNAGAAAPKGGRRARAAAGAGLGLSALLGASASADAAQLVGDVAASDNRLFIILGLFLPAIGWVLFNMAGPVLNQINSMAEKNAGAPSKGKGGKKR